jgi:hypothetical protein
MIDSAVVILKIEDRTVRIDWQTQFSSSRTLGTSGSEMLSPGRGESNYVDDPIAVLSIILTRDLHSDVHDDRLSLSTRIKLISDSLISMILRY